MGKLTITGTAASRDYEKTVNAALQDIIAKAAALSPYDVEVFQGLRYGDGTSRHLE